MFGIVLAIIGAFFVEIGCSVAKYEHAKHSENIWAAIFQETADKYPQIQGYIRTSFAGVGFMGSYILQLIFGRAKSAIRNIVDEKTNELDRIKTGN